MWFQKFPGSTGYSDVGDIVSKSVINIVTNINVATALVNKKTS